MIWIKIYLTLCGKEVSMKKIFKFIPLLLLPFALSSCSFITNLFNRGEESGDTSSTVYPTSLTITGEDSITVGGSTILTATYTPSNVTNKTVSWSSSNDSVATVSSSGRVKGRANGAVTITASMKGKNNATVTATHEISVGTPAATGIALSQTSLDMSYGSTARLKATVAPKNSNQTVNWTTSNSSIVALTTPTQTTESNPEMTIVAGSTTGNAVITATSVDGNFTATCNVSVSEVSGTTIMIYMCGADLESGSDSPGYLNSGKAGLASMDLDEILSVSGQPSNVNIVVQTGGANSWAKSNINASKSQRWEIRNRTMTQVSSESKKNMGLQSTLQEFVTWGLTNYKAAKYGLIMWNHGGAMGGCCFDEQYSDDSISADELYNAVKNARSSAGISSKLDWITYDACLMAVQDVADYNSENFNYMLCSQESEAGYGYDYDAWLPSLYNNPSISGADLLPVIGHTFIEEEKQIYQSYYGSRWQQYFDQTQSVYDLSKMAAYKTVFESLASDLNSIIGSNSSKTQTLGNLIAEAREYGLDEYGESSGFEIRDLKEALNKIKANSTFSSTSSKVTAVLNAMEQLVIYEEHGQGTTGCGICLFCPMQYNYRYGSSTKSNFTNWITVANKIYNAM